MKHLYMALPLVLLLIGTDGWAGDQHKPVTMWDDSWGCNKCTPNNSGWLLCTYDECPVERVGLERVKSKHTPTCEKRMRDAMNAMDPFVRMTVTIDSVDAVYKSPATQLREEADRIDRRDHAVEQWRETMKECVQ